MKKNNFLIIIILSIFLGLIAGVAGGIIVKSYLLNNFSISKKIDFIKDSDNQEVVIKDAKKIVVEQNVKVSETIDSAKSSIVGIFKKQSTTKGSSGVNFNLNNYYQLDQNIGQGLIITSDGWIVTDLLAKDIGKFTDYVVISRDKNIYFIDKVIEDNLTGFSFIHAIAKDFPVKKIISDNEIKNGNLVISLNWQGDSLLSTIVSQRDDNIKLVNSSDSSLREIILEGKLNQKNNKVIVFNLTGDIVALSDSQGIIRPMSQLTGAINSIFNYKEIKRPVLGVNYINLTNLALTDIVSGNNLQKGAVISKNSDGIAVVKDSPAFLAGFKVGDIIISIDDVELDENNNLAKIIQQHITGDKIDVEYLRSGEKKQANIILGQLK